MPPLSAKLEGRFVVATPARSVCDDNARALYRHDRLRFLALGTRRGTAGVPPEFTRLKPSFGLLSYAAARTLSLYSWESFRLRMHPWFDRWVRRQLTAGDHIISSYGYANASFRWVREHGGRTFLDGGSSHPDNFWTTLNEEHRRWNCPYPPIARHHYERSLAMLPDVDYVLSPSSFVTRSFLEHGFKPQQILKNVYPVNLENFAPPSSPRSKDRPLTIINTGSLSLRKGTPYLLEAFRIIRRAHPTARLMLHRNIQNDVAPVVAKYTDLNIDWSPPLNHAQLAARLGSADIYILPSIEDGFPRTVLEALACGLPAIVTPNTGTSDLIQPGINGEIVPIRDPQAIADAALKWAERVLSQTEPRPRLVAAQSVSFNHFENEFIRQLTELGFLSGSRP